MLWIDAGVVVARPIEEVFEIIARARSLWTTTISRAGPCSTRPLLTPRRHAGWRPRATSCWPRTSARASSGIYVAARRRVDRSGVRLAGQRSSRPKHLSDAEAGPLAKMTATKKAQYRGCSRRTVWARRSGASACSVSRPTGHRQDQSIYSILCAPLRLQAVFRHAFLLVRCALEPGLARELEEQGRGRSGAARTICPSRCRPRRSRTTTAGCTTT